MSIEWLLSPRNIAIHFQVREAVGELCRPDFIDRRALLSSRLGPWGALMAMALAVMPHCIRLEFFLYRRRELINRLPNQPRNRIVLQARK